MRCPKPATTLFPFPTQPLWLQNTVYMAILHPTPPHHIMFFSAEHRSLKTSWHGVRTFTVQGLKRKPSNTPGSSTLSFLFWRTQDAPLPPAPPPACDHGEASRDESGVLGGLCSKPHTVTFLAPCWKFSQLGAYEVRACYSIIRFPTPSHPLEWNKGGERRACNFLGKGAGELTWT